MSDTKRRVIATVILSAIGVVLPFSLDIESVNMLGRYVALAILAVSLDLLWGYTGMLCLCQSLFFALGGYAIGMYLAHHGGPEGIIDAAGWKLPACLYVVYPYAVGEVPSDAAVPWFWKPFYSLPAAVGLGLLIPGLVALVVGYFVFKSRVRGVFFAILTQAFTLAAWLVFCLNNMKLCGTNGLTRFVNIAGYDLFHPNVRLCLYFISLLSLVGVYWLCYAIVKSRLGRVLIAIRDNENRVRFSGYKPYQFKVFVFTISAMIAGLGGVLYAPQMGIFTPTNMEVKESILVVIWVAVGGRGSLSGPILGAMVVNLTYNFLTSKWPESWPFVQGAMFISVVLILPDGLISLLRKWEVLKSIVKKNGKDSHKTPEAEDVVSVNTSSNGGAGQ